jgi:hypothetical protein
MAGSGLSVTARPEGFDELAAASAKFAKTQEKLLRLNIYNAAKTVVGYVRTEVTSGSYEADAGMRAGIAKGLKVEVDMSSQRPGVRIEAAADGMPEGKQAMPAAWEKSTFNHPVFNTGVVVEQSGNPGWFTKTVAFHKDKIDKAVNDAMVKAGATLAGGSA